ncbi:sensor domain-containing diguanylate cyclase [Thiomicrospira microaerophila]|uniref:sensor domain-containing diguanylate cyclase n=1 Tax=Thiomicrospira microaerophila TaxID=406020 RepID=UPI00200FA6D2|nr:sensor domain-containing diguanylate cyclase [Thiomicrospira microaerophila]UQB42200.1 sensor domain-containing diguanylate cyclase [Thiomicrospira microaerophila]
MSIKCDKSEPIWPLIIIGAGPIGIEAAIYAKKLGVEPLVLESSSTLASTLSALGDLTLYPEAQLIMTPLGLEWVEEASSISYLTAKTYRDFYLKPLVERSGLNLELNCRVEAISKPGVPRDELDIALRKAAAFKLLVSTEQGSQTLFAEHVIDASGVYQAPLPLGDSRVVVEGEAEFCLSIQYQLADFAAYFDQYDGQTILLFGDGYLAQSSLARFISLKEHWSASTRLICIKERADSPFFKTSLTSFGSPSFADIERTLSQDPSLSDKVSFMDHTRVMAIQYNPAQPSLPWSLSLCRGDQALTLKADQVISNYGFQVDPSLWQDLHIEQSYTNGGPLAYTQSLLSRLDLDTEVTTAMPAFALRTPEPNFYVLGAKTYGSKRGFISRIGLGQIVALFQLIAQDKHLNLYGGFADNLVASEPTLPKGVAFKLSDSEQIYKTLNTFSQDVVFQTDLQQRITYLSDSWLDLTGIDPHYYLGLNWQEMFETHHLKTTLSKDLLLVNQGQGRNLFSIKCANGSRKWVMIYPRPLIDKEDQAYGVISSLKDVSEQIELSQKLDELKALQKNATYHDEATGTATRLKLTEMLRLNYSLFKRYGTPFSVLMLSIDQFKEYSQSEGEKAGLELRNNFSRMVKNALRISDEFGCWQAEKYIIVAASNELVDAYQLAEKLRLMIASSLLVPDTEMTISVGVVSIEVDETIEGLLERVEKLYRQARLEGKNTVKY